MAAAHGIPCRDVPTAHDLAPSLAAATAEGGVRMLVARTDRAANVAVHEELAAAVGLALEGLSG